MSGCPRCDSDNTAPYCDAPQSRKEFCKDCGCEFNPSYPSYESDYEFWHKGYCGRCRQKIVEVNDAVKK